MATMQERVGVLETRVTGIDEKIDDLKTDVKEMHDCLDRTRDDLVSKLDTMYTASCTQHAELNRKIESMERLKDKWVHMAWGGLAVISVVSGHWDKISQIFH